MHDAAGNTSRLLPAVDEVMSASALAQQAKATSFACG
jgi:hypothetical protein